MTYLETACIDGLCLRSLKFNFDPEKVGKNFIKKGHPKGILFGDLYLAQDKNLRILHKIIVTKIIFDRVGQNGTIKKRVYLFTNKGLAWIDESQPNSPLIAFAEIEKFIRKAKPELITEGKNVQIYNSTFK